MAMLPVTYGYALVSKSGDDAKNLDTQLRLLANHGTRDDLIFTDVASGRTMNRPGAAGPDRPGSTRRHHRSCVPGPVLPELRGGSAHPSGADRRNIGIAAVREKIDTTDEGPAAKFFRRSMLAQGAYQVDLARLRRFLNWR